MPKTRGLGATISYLPTFDSVAAVILIGSLVSIAEITPESEELDATTLDSLAGYREYLQGFKDSGELPLVGYQNSEDAGQTKCRELYASGAVGYWWVTFSDGTQVIFVAYVKSYTAGAADVDGIVGFGAKLRVSGLIQVITVKDGVAQSKAIGATATLDGTASALNGTPTYQWYSNDAADYLTPTLIAGATGATYTTPALTVGVKYYFCVVTVAGYRPVYGPIHVVTVA